MQIPTGEPLLDILQVLLEPRKMQDTCPNRLELRLLRLGPSNLLRPLLKYSPASLLWFWRAFEVSKITHQALDVFIGLMTCYNNQLFAQSHRLAIDIGGRYFVRQMECGYCGTLVTASGPGTATSQIVVAARNVLVATRTAARLQQQHSPLSTCHVCAKVEPHGDIPLQSLSPNRGAADWGGTNNPLIITLPVID